MRLLLSVHVSASSEPQVAYHRDASRNKTKNAEKDYTYMCVLYIYRGLITHDRGLGLLDEFPRILGTAERREAKLFE